MIIILFLYIILHEGPDAVDVKHGYVSFVFNEPKMYSTCSICKVAVCVRVFLGEPVQCTAWAGQCALYIFIMMFEKVVIILVLLIPQWKKVSDT